MFEYLNRKTLALYNLTYKLSLSAITVVVYQTQALTSRGRKANCDLYNAIVIKNHNIEQLMQRCNCIDAQTPKLS